MAATFDGGDAVRAEPFDAIELKLGDLWIGGAGDDPRTSEVDL